MNNNETPSAHARLQASHDEIARRAEEIWRQYGCPQGRDEEIWLEAERQLRGLQLDPAETTTTIARAPESESLGSTASATPAPTDVQPKIKPQQSELMQQPAGVSSGRKGRARSGGK